MEDAGIATDPEATGWDLAQQAVQLPADTAGGMDCLMPANIGGLRYLENCRHVEWNRATLGSA